MRKPIVLASLMLALLTLTALMPVVKAIYYSWDGIIFVEGSPIKYPHPARDYNNISPYNSWSKKGHQLYHHQVDDALSAVIVKSAVLVCATIGSIIGAKIAPPWGAVIGTIAGGVLGLYVTYASEAYFLDEKDCIWWWISLVFMDWLSDNAVWLAILYLTNPTQAQNAILNAFITNGYVRVGRVTYYDATGVGEPYPKGGGAGPGPEPCPTLFVWNGSDYVDLGVIDIHADGDVVREVSVPSERVGIFEYKAQFRLREGWEGLTYSHSQIDQVKLQAVDLDGSRRLCPLIEATHSELGNVLPRLLLSDDTRIDLYLLETIDLEFVVPCQTDEIEDFAFVIEGCNMIKV